MNVEVSQTIDPKTSAQSGSLEWKTLDRDLSAFFRRRVSDPTLADDLKQEALLRVYRGLQKLRTHERMSVWIYRIARNVLIDSFRQRKKSISPLDEENVAATDSQTSVELSLSVSRWLPVMIARLPTLYRYPIFLSEIEGRSHAEIADRLEISVAASKSRVRRGRQILGQMIASCCDFQFDRDGRLVHYERRESPCLCETSPPNDSSTGQSCESKSCGDESPENESSR